MLSLGPDPHGVSVEKDLGRAESIEQLGEIGLESALLAVFGALGQHSVRMRKVLSRLAADRIVDLAEESNDRCAKAAIDRPFASGLGCSSLLVHLGTEEAMLGRPGRRSLRRGKRWSVLVPECRSDRGEIGVTVAARTCPGRAMVGPAPPAILASARQALSETSGKASCDERDVTGLWKGRSTRGDRVTPRRSRSLADRNASLRSARIGPLHSELLRRVRRIADRWPDPVASSSASSPSIERRASWLV